MKSSFNNFLRKYGFESSLDLDPCATDKKALDLRLAQLEREFDVPDDEAPEIINDELAGVKND